MRPWPRLQFVLPQGSGGCGLFAPIKGVLPLWRRLSIDVIKKSLVLLTMRSFVRRGQAELAACKTLASRPGAACPVPACADL